MPFTSLKLEDNHHLEELTKWMGEELFLEYKGYKVKLSGSWCGSFPVDSTLPDALTKDEYFMSFVKHNYADDGRKQNTILYPQELNDPHNHVYDTGKNWPMFHAKCELRSADQKKLLNAIVPTVIDEFQQSHFYSNDFLRRYPELEWVLHEPGTTRGGGISISHGDDGAKIYNPQTKKMVNVRGGVGRKLLKKYAPMLLQPFER